MRFELVLTLAAVPGLIYAAPPELRFSTLLGGSAQTVVTATVLDTAGNIVVAGNTAASDFPTTKGAFQTTYAGGQCGAEPTLCRAIFVSKFTPDGSKLLFSTYLDGAGDDMVAGIALDPAGNVYLAGTTAGNLPGLTPFLGDELRYGSYAAKLSADGSKLIYNVLLPIGSYYNNVTGIAIDPTGAAYVAGWGTGGITPVNAFQASPKTAQIFKTGDAGAHWQAIMDDLPVAQIRTMAADPSNPLVLYLGIVAGLYKSTDGGEHWQLLPSLNVEPSGIAVDFSNPETIYVSTLTVGSIFKSTDGGQTWSSSASGLAPFGRSIVIDPKNTATLYAVTDTGLYKSTDAAATWKPTGLISPSDRTFFTGSIVLDPSNPAILYAGTRNGVMRSADGGATWTTIANGLAPGAGILSLVIDPANPNVLYASTDGSSDVYRTTDSGAHWIAGSWPDPLNFVRHLLVDPSLPSTVWAGSTKGVLVSRDGGATWGWPSTTIPEQPVNALAASGGQIYAAENAIEQQDAFVMKLDPSGTKLVYSTYLSGSGSDLASGIAVDSAGRAYVAGTTDSFDFPISNALQRHLAGGRDGFVTVLNPSGSGLVWSTYFGGSGEDNANAIALDGAGNIHLAGDTTSWDLPLVQPTQTKYGGFTDAWAAIIRRDAAALQFSSYFGGSGTDYASAVATDAAGNTYIAGITNSRDLPVNTIQTSLAGVSNSFVAGWTASANQFAFATYLGGNNVDRALGLAANDRGEVYVGGQTSSLDFPVAYPFQDRFALCTIRTCFNAQGFLAGIGSFRFPPKRPISMPVKRGRLP